MDDSRKSKAQLITELQALRKQAASSSGKAAANQTPVSQQQSKDRYRIVSELTSDYAFAYRVEPDGEMVREWVTGALLKISGFTAADLETRGGWPSMIHPDDLLIPLGQFKTIMQGQPNTVEYRIITKSGAVRWTRDYARPEWDEQQQRVTHIYGAIQDITERKLAEQALENKNHQLELLLQIAQRLTASLDRQEVLTRVGVDAKQVLKSHGCSIYLLEPGGQTLLPVVALDPLYGEELLHTPLAVESSFTGQAVQSRQSLIFNDAETYDIGQQIPGTPNEHEHIITAPFIAGEKVLGAMCLNRLQTGYDETDRTLAEMFAAYATIALKNAQAYDGLQQEIQKRGQVEESLRSTNHDLAAALGELRNTQTQLIQQERLAAVGQLAAGIAHDFNNIMAAILLYAELLLRMPDLSPQSRKKINVIHHQGKRAADLTQQILDFGRKSIMKRQSLDIYAFLSEMVELLKRTLPEAIQLTLGGEGSACLVDADPTRLQQVIMNLAINARGAMPDGGSLHFAIKRVQAATDGKRPLPTLTSGDWVQVTVTDTGAGIPADVLPHIFEPFFTTRPPHGSGLGLSQVYGIIKQHGGEIDVVTEVGRGTTFCLYLPALTVSQPTTPENHSSQLTPGQAETILVVEDDATLRAALKQSLESLGYHILDAANGEEALACFWQDNDRITLVLTDIVMPKMGGAALLNKLQAIKPALKAVVMTGYPAAGIKADLQSVNVMGWLQKPVNLQRLGKIVAQVIGNSPH